MDSEGSYLKCLLFTWPQSYYSVITGEYSIINLSHSITAPQVHYRESFNSIMSPSPSFSINCPNLQFFLSLGGLYQSLWYCRNQVFELQQVAIFLGCTLSLEKQNRGSEGAVEGKSRGSGIGTNSLTSSGHFCTERYFERCEPSVVTLQCV